MSAWQVFRPPHGRARLKGTATVYVLAGGTLVMTDDLVERLGTPKCVEYLTNGTGHHLGIRVATSVTTGVQYKLARYGGTAWQLNVNQVLWALGRRGGKRVLPHHWEGDVLVIDVASLPTRPPREAR